MASELNQLLKQAIELAQAGQRDEARHLLEQIIAQDPRQSLAWLWLATVATNDEERISALLRVLELDPDNQTARAALDKLGVIVPPAGARTEAGTSDDRDLDVLPAWLQPKPAPASTPLPKREAFLSQRELMIVAGVGVAAIILILSLFIGSEVIDSLSNTPTPTLTNTPSPIPTWTPSITPTPRPTNTLPPVLTLPPELTETPTPTITLTRTPRPTWTPLPTRTPYVRPTREPDETWRIFGG